MDVDDRKQSYHFNIEIGESIDGMMSILSFLIFPKVITRE